MHALNAYMQRPFAISVLGTVHWNHTPISMKITNVETNFLNLIKIEPTFLLCINTLWTLPDAPKYHSATADWPPSAWARNAPWRWPRSSRATPCMISGEGRTSSPACGLGRGLSTTRPGKGPREEKGGCGKALERDRESLGLISGYQCR